MGWEHIPELLAGLFKRFWSKEAKEESRDNEIDKLKKKQLELAKNNTDGRYDSRLESIARRLSRLHKNAQNSR